ncbi:hypothetical protein [Chondromyces apiculatus]|uniref:Uncharacterized protein n=1 Tax=Chondromyces apiculatus DSM 436 TaxID=1192034 RepID=A0A017T0H4_9BACT|nr:hypothetical protein [Chondromyces apiculatus]EYF02723.1 Hypothetical protein CAP_6613 [Chondromyces apiculatus DSM 436]
MKISMKLTILAIAAAPLTLSAPALADNNCGSSDESTIIQSMNRVLGQAEEVMLLDGIQASNICLVNVNESLNGDIVTLLAVERLAALNDLQIGALQSVLSDLIVIAAGDDVIDIEDFLNDNDISLEDIVAADVASGNLILFYMPAPV